MDVLLLFSAFSLAPLAKVATLDFSTPLFATVLAVSVLRETIRLRRILALVAGFFGALIVLRPGLGVSSPAPTSRYWPPLRRAGDDRHQGPFPYGVEPDIVLYTFVFSTPFTLLVALPVWETPSLEQMAMLAVIGVFSVCGHLCLTQAFKEADLTAVLPLNFLRLIWLALIGYLVFDEIPDIWTWVGGIVIFVSATYGALRESSAKNGDAERPAIS